jgi:hypothetical protein
MSDIEPAHQSNIRAQSYFIAETALNCWHCGSSTRVLGLALTAGHETHNEDEQAGAWHRADGDAVLFYIERLPAPVQVRLAEASPFFVLSNSSATWNAYWANHCENCGSLLEDHELHCEPGGAFMPWSEAAAARIRFRKINEQFEATSAGYAFDPEFIAVVDKS